MAWPGAKAIEDRKISKQSSCPQGVYDLLGEVRPSITASKTVCVGLRTMANTAV